jgi:hypothetical protein
MGTSNKCFNCDGKKESECRQTSAEGCSDKERVIICSESEERPKNIQRLVGGFNQDHRRIGEKVKKK